MATLAAAARLAADEAAADPPAAASLRSAGGQGASALLQVPTLPCHRLTTAQLDIALRFRLILDLPGCAGPPPAAGAAGPAAGAAVPIAAVVAGGATNSTGRFQ